MSTARSTKRRAPSSTPTTSVNTVPADGQSTFQLVLSPNDPTTPLNPTPTYSFQTTQASAPADSDVGMSMPISSITMSNQPKTISFAPNITPVTYSSPSTLDDDFAYLEATAASNPQSSLNFGEFEFDSLRRVDSCEPPPTKRRRKGVSAKNTVKKESQPSQPSSPASPTSSPSPSAPSPTDPTPPSPVPQHIPRPPNAFILFRSSFIKSQSVSSRTEGNHGTLSKIVGMLWHNLSYEEQLIWKVKARRVYAEHRKRYPGYSFRTGGGKDGKDRNEKNGESGEGSSKGAKNSSSDSAAGKEKKESSTSLQSSAANKSKNSNTLSSTNPSSKPAPKVRKTRQVGPRDIERCTHIASLLAAGLKGERLDAAMQEFDMARRPRELRMQFEVPITKEGWAAANAKDDEKKSGTKEIPVKEEKEREEDKAEAATESKKECDATAPLTTTQTQHQTSLTQPRPIKPALTNQSRVRRSSSAPIPGTGSDCIDGDYNFSYAQHPITLPTQHHGTPTTDGGYSASTAFYYGQERTTQATPYVDSQPTYAYPQQSQEQHTYSGQVYQQQTVQCAYEQSNVYTENEPQHIPQMPASYGSASTSVTHPEIMAPIPTEPCSLAFQRRKRSASSSPPIRRPSYTISHSLSYSAAYGTPHQQAWLSPQQQHFSFSAVHPSQHETSPPVHAQEQGVHAWGVSPPDFSNFSFSSPNSANGVADGGESVNNSVVEAPSPLSPIKASTQPPITSVTPVCASVTDTSVPVPVPADDYDYVDMPNLVEAPATTHMIQQSQQSFYPSYQDQQQSNSHPQLSIQTSWPSPDYTFSPVPISASVSTSAMDIPPSSAVSGVSFFGGFDGSGSPNSAPYDVDTTVIPQSPATMSASVSVGTPRDDQEALSITPTPVVPSRQTTGGYNGYDAGYDNNYKGYTYEGYDTYDVVPQSESIEYNGVSFTLEQMRAMLSAIQAGKITNLEALRDGKKTTVGFGEENTRDFSHFIQGMAAISH